MKFRKIIKKAILLSPFKPIEREITRWRLEKKEFIEEARQQFAISPRQSGSFSDYKKAYRRHRVTYGEYMYKFEYWKLNEHQRNEFISCSEMQCIYRKMVQPEVRTILFNKVLFLNKFQSFVHRRWIEVQKSTYDEFCDMVYSFDCIAKPIEGWRGNGIHKIQKVAKGTDVKYLYDECVTNNILLEECIHACKEIEDFHPQSLNTIRVVTISNPNKCEVFGAILRMGVGDNIIDNTHNGGVFASIDVNTGIIETDGLDSEGNYYAVHPNTGKQIKGFTIPQWDKVIETCTEATKVLPNMIFAGWDAVVMDDGTVALVEGNHAPDFDGGMQAPKKIGVKQRVKKTVMDLYGIDPLRFIAVTSGTMNGYRYNEKVIV